MQGMNVIRELEKMIANKSLSVQSEHIDYIKKEIEEWSRLLITLILHSTNTNLAEIMTKESTGSLQFTIRQQASR